MMTLADAINRWQGLDDAERALKSSGFDRSVDHEVDRALDAIFRAKGSLKDLVRPHMDLTWGSRQRFVSHRGRLFFWDIVSGEPRAFEPDSVEADSISL